MEPPKTARPIVGIFWMIVTGFNFVGVTAIVKHVGDDVPAAQAAFLRYVLGLVFLIPMIKPILAARLTKRQVKLFGWRGLVHTIAVILWFYAMARIPIAEVTAMNYLSPVYVAIGAALFLGEVVGWRRWTAILVGFCGVLLILRPGLDGFDWNVLFAVQGMLGLSIRDLATRRAPPSLSALQLSFAAFSLLVPAGALAMWSQGTGFVHPDGGEWLLVIAAALMGAFSYRFIVTAMRLGDIAVVTSFRYSRMIFALVIGIAVFAEWPDSMTLLGAAIIIGSGLYTLWREQRVKSTAAA